MKFYYDRTEFVGTYDVIVTHLTNHLQLSTLWLIKNDFVLCNEKYKREQSSNDLCMIKNILINRILAKIPTPSEYFNANAEIHFNNGLIQIHIDDMIIGCDEGHMDCKHLQKIKEVWINDN